MRNGMVYTAFAAIVAGHLGNEGGFCLAVALNAICFIVLAWLRELRDAILLSWCVVGLLTATLACLITLGGRPDLEPMLYFVSPVALLVVSWCSVVE